MRFFHTFWSKPVLQNEFDKGNRDRQLMTNLYCYALSASYVKKFGHHIELYTDKIGAEWLKDIPYDKVHIVEPLSNHSCFAAQLKFVGYERCQLGDCYIDGDVFLWRKDIYDTLQQYSYNYDCIVQSIENIEYCFDGYEKTINVLSDVQLKFPTSILINPYNAGLVKINNDNLRKEYVDLYKESVKLCPPEKSDITHGIWYDFVIEQRFLTQLTDGRYSVYPLLGEQRYGENDSEIDIKSSKLGYLHLAGQVKYESLDRLLRMFDEVAPDLKPLIINKANMIIEDLKKGIV